MDTLFIATMLLGYMIMGSMLAYLYYQEHKKLYKAVLVGIFWIIMTPYFMLTEKN